MEEVVIFKDNGSPHTSGTGEEENMEGSGNPLDGITHNLDKEMAALGENRRNTEVSTLSGGLHAAVARALWASSFLPHNHVHQRVVVDDLVWFGQEDKFLQFLGQIASIITNRKIVERFLLLVQ